jgi:hypothetical protein
VGQAAQPRGVAFGGTEVESVVAVGFGTRLGLVRDERRLRDDGRTRVRHREHGGEPTGDRGPRARTEVFFVALAEATDANVRIGEPGQT